MSQADISLSCSSLVTTYDNKTPTILCSKGVSWLNSFHRTIKLASYPPSFRVSLGRLGESRGQTRVPRNLRTDEPTFADAYAERNMLIF